MNYKLAKQLKDAGFPQETTRYYLEDEFENGEIGFSKGEWNNARIAYPTLSELTEACRDKFRNLSYTEVKGGERLWFASGEYIKDEEYYQTAGYNTPEEAVAKLWLELNKK